MPSEVPPSPRDFAPVQNAFLPDIEESDEENSKVYQHFPQPEALQIAQNNGPRIDEDRLNIEQNEQHGDQIELYREALPGVAHRGHAAFVGREFGAGWFTLPDQPRKQDNRGRNPAGHKNMD